MCIYTIYDSYSSFNLNFYQHVGSFILTSEESAELKMDDGLIFSRSKSGCMVVSVLPSGVD